MRRMYLRYNFNSIRIIYDFKDRDNPFFVRDIFWYRIDDFVREKLGAYIPHML